MISDDLSRRPNPGAAEERRATRWIPAGAGGGFGVFGVLVFALVCLAVIGLVAHHGVHRLRDDAAWVAHTREVIGNVGVLLSDVTEVESAIRAFVITGDESYARAVPEGFSNVGARMTRLRQLTADNPGQQRRAETLGVIVDRQFAFERRLLGVRRDGGLASAQALLATPESKELHDRLRTAVEEMKRIEERLLDDRQTRAARGAAVADLVIVGGSVVAFSFVGVALIAIRRDYIGRVAAEAKTAAAYDELAREKARFEFIFEAAPVGVSYAITDASGQRTRLVNSAHLQICGLSRADFDQPENFVRITHPDDRPLQAQLAADLAAGKIDRYAVDKRYVRSSGEIVWVMLSFERRHHSDGSYEDLSVVVDITKRKRAEAELEHFFEVSLDFLTIAGPDGFFKRVNPTVTDTLGWSVEEFLSQPYLDLVHPDDREATMREVERQIVGGEKVLHFENRYRHKDGSWRTLSWRSVPHADGLMYGAARDVTDSRRAELEIRRLNVDLRERAAQVEAANRELEAFSYSVSHDLRAPLRHVSGYIAMLARDSAPQLSEKGRRYLDTIGTAAREMGMLIDDLLSFSRMGRVDMCKTSVDLNAIVDEVRRDLELAARDRHIVWEVGALPPVRGDRSMLKQAFVNLLENALKYTRPRSPAVIAVGCAGEENGRAVIFVRDNGVGFEMKYADKLFGVFQRLHRADEFEGTGVGLANVQRIVMRHGGRVWAQAKPDEGATFFLTLERIADGDARSESAS